MTGAPLAGIRVLELGTMYAAPTAGRMLRDFGADLIKVEEPQAGDYARQWTPQKDGLSLGFSRLNAGKRSVGIDLRSARGRELVVALAARVDVVIESFRPGRLEAWGLGYDVLSAANPGLVLARVSGFGQSGPYRERPGFGTVAETASGFAYINGWPQTPPTSPPFGFADSIAGISAAMGTAMALYEREKTGRGRVVDVALYEPLMFIVGDMILKYTTLGEVQGRIGNGTGSASPRGVYQAADGEWLSIAASNQAIARRLFAAMGEPELIDDERFATNAARLAHNDAIQEKVAGWVAGLPRSAALKLLDEHEVVASAVNSSRDIVQDPHFLLRTLLPITGSEILGPALVPGPVLHLDGYSGPAYHGVPGIGEHTAAVLGELLEIGPAELGDLAGQGVISGPEGPDTPARLGLAAVDPEHRPGGVAGGGAGQVQRRADDLLGLAAAAKREALGPGRERVHVPGRADIGEEGPRHDRVAPHGGAERVRQPDRDRGQPCLGRRVGHDVGPGPVRPGAGDVDDRSALAGRHPGAGQRGQPERPFHVDRDHLVEQFLGDRVDPLVPWRHARVVDQDVEPPEPAVDRVDQPVEFVPVPDVRRVRHGRTPGTGRDLGGRLLAGLRVAAGDDQIGAGRGKAVRHGPAEPPAAAGDQGDLAGQIERGYRVERQNGCPCLHG
jgi:crotonobetainyl-CoA:carnitine CoA-transferase CaiB-like acyl-CoA transferase